MGNKADVSGNDLLQWWEEDDATQVILLYLESFGNPRKFSRIARRVGRSKPIVAVKSGRSQAGTRAASSHTAALASSDQAVDALFHQTGVVRVETIEELFDVGEILAHQPVPAGRRVAIMGNAGGPGVLAADACISHGLEVPELSDRAPVGPRRPPARRAPASQSRSTWWRRRPPRDTRQVLEALLGSDEIDIVIVIFTPPLVTRADDVAHAVVGAVDAATDRRSEQDDRGELSRRRRGTPDPARRGPARCRASRTRRTRRGPSPMRRRTVSGGPGPWGRSRSSKAPSPTRHGG